MNCDQCEHVDYHAAKESKMKFWGLCKFGTAWEFSGRLTKCHNGKFRQADASVVAKRMAWIKSEKGGK